MYRVTARTEARRAYPAHEGARSTNGSGSFSKLAWGRATVGLLCLAVLGLPAPLHAGFLDQFEDPVDGEFDASNWLVDRHGLLPVPIIITEPAVGYGGGLALVYFHKRKKVAREPGADDAPAKWHPPSVSAVFGLGTENGTWAAGGYHLGIWRDDTIRYRGAAGYADVNIAFYRDSRALDFNIATPILSQELDFRVGKSDFFLGGRYFFTSTTATRESGPPGLLPDAVDTRVGGLGLVTRYDNRDNIFSPNRGQDLALIGTFYDPALGGSTTWQELDFQIHSFHQPHERLVLGLRLDGSHTWGDVPFFSLPYVDLEGIPAMRYQGNGAGQGEARARWRAWRRWSLVGFFGLGWTTGADATDSGPFPAGGGGIRYLLARKLGLQVGIDVARGPEDTAFYIIVGNAW
jgi:hypothetical protein